MTTALDDRRLQEVQSELLLLHDCLERIAQYLQKVHPTAERGELRARQALDDALEIGRILRDLQNVPTVLPVDPTAASPMDHAIRGHLKRVSRICTKVGRIKESHDVFGQQQGEALDAMICDILRDTGAIP